MHSVNSSRSDKFMRLLIIIGVGSLFSSCAGYQLGSAKPPSLENVRRIAVPMMKNGTLHPRAESIATSAVNDAIVQDGSFRLSTVSKADAVLDAEIDGIEYNTLRSSRLDSSVAEELTNTVEIDWVLRDAVDPTKILASGSSVGESSFFVDSNLQTARQNALPDAFERAAVNLVSRLASGY